jgi:hypothetical protein
MSSLSPAAIAILLFCAVAVLAPTPSVTPNNTNRRAIASFHYTFGAHLRNWATQIQNANVQAEMTKSEAKWQHRERQDREHHAGDLSTRLHFHD